MLQCIVYTFDYLEFNIPITNHAMNCKFLIHFSYLLEINAGKRKCNVT